MLAAGGIVLATEQSGAAGLLELSPLGLSFRPGPSQVPHEGPANAQVEEEAGQNERGPPPPVQIEQVVIERRKQEGPNARAAHREARSKTAVVVEIVRDYHNRGHIAQGEAKPRDQTKRHQEDVD